jgi:MoaA/NifB/PqqE/SkfB family radical SAM enzyme
MDNGYKVSPYLQEITATWLPYLKKHLPKGALERLGSSRDVMVIDFLNWKLTEIPHALNTFLRKLRRDNAAVADLSDPMLRFAAANDLLAREDVILRRHGYRHIEVEINRHCNYRCGFCPVEKDPKPKGFMTPETFAVIMQKAKDYGKIKSVSMNHYSEPTLDPNLISRVKLAAECGFHVELHTNASLFTREKLEQLAACGNTRLLINVPTVDRAEYERVTGAKLFDRVMQNLKWIHEFKIPTVLSINAPRNEGDKELAKINDELGAMFGDSFLWPTDDRAGLMKKEAYVVPIKLKHKEEKLLNGCGSPLVTLNVTYEGKTFLCCQDFNQEVEFGDLRESSIAQIAENERSVQIRKWLLGFEVPPAGFICTNCSHTCEKTDHLAYGTIPVTVEANVPPTYLMAMEYFSEPLGVAFFAHQG